MVTQEMDIIMGARESLHADYNTNKISETARTAYNTAHSLRAYVLALRDIAPFGRNVVYAENAILSPSPNRTYRTHYPTTHSQQKFKARNW